MTEKVDTEKPLEGTKTSNVLDEAASHHDKSAANSSSASENGDNPAVEKAVESAEPEKSPRNIHGIKWGFAVFSVLSSTFLFALDNTIVADVQPAIVERFGDVSKLPWLSVAFLVAAAGTNLVWCVNMLLHPGRNNIDTLDQGGSFMLNLIPSYSICSLSFSSKPDPPSVVPLI